MVTSIFFKCWHQPGPGRNVATTAKKRKKPDYSSRRAGQQEENLRRRANYHQQPLSARAPLHRDARDDGAMARAHLRARSHHGTAYASATRRRGRPAHQRSAEDSPLRDGNRDRLIGLLTMRAAKTLEYYFMETNLTYHHWLQEYNMKNPIPLEGRWEDVSGEEYLRKLLTGGVNETKYQGGVSDPLFSCVGSMGVDPRALGQRIMDIRSALAKEFIDDLTAVAEENAILMRECAMASLAALNSMDTDEEDAGQTITPHPEMLDATPSIPNTAAEFVRGASETDVERYQRKREESGETSSEESTSSYDEEVRPGLDDINEFESELEAAEKWARRFRLMKESGNKSSDKLAESENVIPVDQSGDDVETIPLESSDAIKASVAEKDAEPETTNGEVKNDKESVADEGIKTTDGKGAVSADAEKRTDNEDDEISK